MLIPALRTATFSFLLLLASASVTLGQTTVTLIEGINSYNGTTDARIGEFNPDMNFGGNSQLVLREETSASFFVRFAIFAAEGGPVPDNAIVTSAILSLYKSAGPAAVVKASRVKRAWNEMEVTWNAFATGSSWQTAGARGANDVETNADGQGSVGDAVADGCDTPAPAACWLNINVTAGVQAFKSGSPNNGWKLAYVSGGVASTDKFFYSSERPDVTVRPKLEVTYTMDNDDCSRADLTLCARFEEAETQFSSTQMTTQGVGGASTTWGVQNKSNALDETRIGLVPGGRDVSNSIRFATLNDDRGVQSQNWERSEVLLTTSQTGASQGQEQWWAHSVKFPADFQMASQNHAKTVFWQFHKDDAAPDGPYHQPNFVLEVYNEPLVAGQQGSRQVIHSRSYGGSDTISQYSYTAGGQTLEGRCLDTFANDVWYDFVHHIRWDAHGNGFHEIWMRRDGEATVRKVLNATSKTTLFQNGSSGWAAYFKFGLYHDFVAGDSAVIHDRLRRGSSYESVKRSDFPATLPSTVSTCPSP